MRVTGDTVGDADCVISNMRHLERAVRDCVVSGRVRQEEAAVRP